MRRQTLTYGRIRRWRSRRSSARVSPPSAPACPNPSKRRHTMADEQAQVVISGAGPNGLMLACELALAGIRPVVLDQLSGPSSEPKANGLVGQVVRMIDMRGLYREFT